MSLCFEAAAGDQRLSFVLPDAPGDAVDAALALSGHELLLEVLEDWLQLALDPRPVPHAGTGAPLLWAESNQLLVGLPWSLLTAQAQGPAWPLLWPELEFEVEVAAFQDAPLPATAQGGVLLLPPAFDSAWRVLLHAREPGLLAEAEWRGPGGELLLCAPPEARVPALAPWRVQLATPCRRPLPELLGWEPPAEPWLPDGRARLHGPMGEGRAGRIAPALAGAGLWLDH